MDKFHTLTILSILVITLTFLWIPKGILAFIFGTIGVMTLVIGLGKTLQPFDAIVFRKEE